MEQTFSATRIANVNVKLVKCKFFFSFAKSTYLLDVLWGQPIKLVQVASTSELRENQWNDRLFFEIVPCHFCGASEVQT